jgi:hypothetical protein
MGSSVRRRFRCRPRPRLSPLDAIPYVSRVGVSQALAGCLFHPGFVAGYGSNLVNGCFRPVNRFLEGPKVQLRRQVIECTLVSLARHCSGHCDGAGTHLTLPCGRGPRGLVLVLPPDDQSHIKSCLLTTSDYLMRELRRPRAATSSFQFQAQKEKRSK